MCLRISAIKPSISGADHATDRDRHTHRDRQHLLFSGWRPLNPTHIAFSFATISSPRNTIQNTLLRSTQQKKITTTIPQSRLNRNSSFLSLEPNQIILGEWGPSVGPFSLAWGQRFSRAVSSCIFYLCTVFIYRACHLQPRTYLFTYGILRMYFLYSALFTIIICIISIRSHNDVYSVQ